MRHAAECVVILAILFMIAICVGTPDVLDGFIKRANAVQCANDPE